MSTFVSVTRLLNEDDIIEAFVRHTATIVDRMILLDNGSTDRTMPILQALHQEGLPITVLQSRSVFFVEQPVNTMLYHAAVSAFRADWVLYLDADEFIDERRAAIRPALDRLAPEIDCVILLMRDYHADPAAPADLLVMNRLTLRGEADPDARKCMVRGGLPPELEVVAGNHGARLPGRKLAAAMLPDIVLAHFPVRDGPNGIAKAAIGSLKVLAAGQAEMAAQMNAHYQPVLAGLRDDPGRLLQNAGMMAARPDTPLVADPIGYAGGALRYTAGTDPAMRAVSRLAAAAEQLARSHGGLLDADPAARQRLLHDALMAQVVWA